MPIVTAGITESDLRHELYRELEQTVGHLDLHPNDKDAAAWLVDVLRAHYRLPGTTIWPDATPEERLSQTVDFAVDVVTATADPDLSARWVIQRIATRMGLDVVVAHGGDEHLVEDAERHATAAVALLRRFVIGEDAPF